MSLLPSVYSRRSSVFYRFSHDIWDPFRHEWPLMSSSHDTAQLVATRIDWRETPEAHIFMADVPGLRKEELEVEDGNVLQIRGQRSRKQEEKTDTCHRIERSSGTVVRRFRLLENAKLDQIKASMENGGACCYCS